MRLLDSDTCVHILRARLPYIDLYAQLGPGTVFISAITYHELFYGALHAPLGKQRHLSTLDDFVERIEILPFTQSSAAFASQVRQDLASKDIIIGPLDTLIAGHAIEHGLTLVTGNVREFSRVDGLTLENWTE